ncbi:MAG TPA: CapA family protein [Ramlibacter sp.]|nr:CapA family protein [Ramlibacter sp.]
MTYQTSGRNARLAFAGDVMLSRGLRPFSEPGYQSLLALLRGCDLAFANLETVVRQPEEGHPNFTMGTPMTTPPALLEDLKWMGFQLVSIANNHATDYGVAGVEAMVAHLRQAGLKAAGAGRNLAAARAPAYVDAACGRVGLVAATSFFRPWNTASDQRPDAVGRPGINPLGFGTTYQLEPAAFDVLSQMAEHLGLAQEKARHARQFYSKAELGEKSADRLTLFGQQFRRGNSYAVETRVNAGDAQANLRAIAEARRQADWVVFSFHSHEFGDGGRLTAQSDAGLTDPGRFAVEFARAAIDAGADVVAGHGPHLTLGAELYRGRPIFHGLGNFIFQNDTVEQFPSEAYRRFGLGHEATPADFLDARTDQDQRGFPAEPEFWEGCLATVDFAAGQLARVVLHPLDLGFGARRAERGRPLLAGGERADRILQRLERLSRRHETTCTREGDTLVLQLS